MANIARKITAIAKEMAKIGRNILSLLVFLLCLTVYIIYIEVSYAQTISGSCTEKLKIIEEKIFNSRFCEIDGDCVEIKFNLNGCSCPSSSNKHNYLNSLELKTNEYYENCVKPYDSVEKCNCPPAVKNKCVWGRCTPIRCKSFNKEYQINECECPVGGKPIYGSKLYKDGRKYKTVICRPRIDIFKELHKP